MENKPTLVVALGGNALLKRGEPLEADINARILSWRQELSLNSRSSGA